MNFYPFHIGDYAAHTRNLSLLEDLAYRRLLDAYYLAGGPLSGCATDVAREIGMREQAVDVEYILTRFFVRDGDLWRQPRADLEILKYQAKREQASRAGKASVERKLNARSTSVEKNSTPVEEVDNGRATNQEPITKNQKELSTPVANATSVDARQRFEMFEQWQPDEVNLSAQQRMQGVASEAITAELVREFVSFWMTMDLADNQGGWCQRLVKWAKGQAARCAAERLEPAVADWAAQGVIL